MPSAELYKGRFREHLVERALSEKYDVGVFYRTSLSAVVENER